MNEIKSEAGISPVLSTAGLDGKRWIEEAVLKQTIMTPEQQETAERGICPKCRENGIQSVPHTHLCSHDDEK